MNTKVLAGVVLAVALLDVGFFLSNRHRTLHSLDISKGSHPAATAPSNISGSQVERPISIATADAEPINSRVAMQITKSRPLGKGTAWDATYTESGRTARFRIEFDPPRGEDKQTDFPISTGAGHFYSIAGSDPASLLVALQKELQAKNIPTHFKRVPSLPFTYVTLGEHNSKMSQGGFSTTPAGDWTATKIFLGEDTDEDEGELFFNFNPITGEAEFSMKDPDYGDIVLRHLITVL